MKKIVITGAAGLVGLNLLDSLKDSNNEIIAIDKSQKNLNLAKKINPKIKTINLDLSRGMVPTEILRNTDLIIQLQAQISSPEKEPYERNNIDSIKNIVEICEENNIPLIHMSSSVVNSVAKDLYTETKTIGENVVKNSKCQYTILRPALMYGCFDVKHLDFIIKSLDNQIIFPMPGSGKYIRQPLFVKDLVNIILKLIELKPENKTFNLIGKERIYFINLLKIIRKQKNKKTIFINLPLPIFSFLFNFYNFLNGKKPYVPEQLSALTAGDIFPLEDWESEFNVKYTPFKEGIRKMLKSPYYNHTKLMEKIE